MKFEFLKSTYVHTSENHIAKSFKSVYLLGMTKNE